MLQPQKITKLKIILILNWRRKIWGNSQRIILFSTQNIVIKLSKIWVWDPGTGKIIFRVPDPGAKKAPDPDPQHWFLNSRKYDPGL